jgi:hypothetical protein
MCIVWCCELNDGPYLCKTRPIHQMPVEVDVPKIPFKVSNFRATKGCSENLQTRGVLCLFPRSFFFFFLRNDLIFHNQLEETCSASTHFSRS